MRCIQLRDILDALKENSESDSWIQELHRKSRKKKDFENALDTKNRTRFWEIFKIILNLAFHKLSESIIKFIILLMTND